MPASLLLELLFDLVGQLVVEGTSIAARSAREAHQRAKDRKRARALSMADVWVLAAHHDHRVTEQERTELARRLHAVFKGKGVDVTVDELILRWKRRRAALRSDADVTLAVRRLTKDLPEADIRHTFDGVVALAWCDRTTVSPAEGPFRTAAPPPPSTLIRLFGHGLRIDAAVIEKAAKAAP